LLKEQVLPDDEPRDSKRPIGSGISFALWEPWPPACHLWCFRWDSFFFTVSVQKSVKAAETAVRAMTRWLRRTEDERVHQSL